MAFEGFPLTDELRNYDVFPKVLVKGKKTIIRIRTLGEMPVF